MHPRRIFRIHDSRDGGSSGSAHPCPPSLPPTQVRASYIAPVWTPQNTTLTAADVRVANATLGGPCSPPILG